MSASIQNCVCANCAPDSTFLIKLAGVQPGGGSIGASATPTKKCSAAPDRAPMRQATVIAHRHRGRREARRIEIEHRLGLGLIALARVVPLEHQKVGDAERRGSEQLALQGNAIAIATGELQNGLDTVLQQHACSDRRFEVRARARTVGHIDRVGEPLERCRLGEQIGQIARRGRRDLRGKGELPLLENVLQATHRTILTSSPV